MQFVCLWCCVPPDFVVQVKNFFSFVLFSTVIHKRAQKLISKTIKYKLDSSSKMQIALFNPREIQIFFGKLSILLEIWKWLKSQGAGGYVLSFIMTQCVRKSIFDSPLTLICSYSFRGMDVSVFKESLILECQFLLKN